jgi:hypothetical protein
MVLVLAVASDTKGPPPAGARGPVLGLVPFTAAPFATPQ